MRVLKLEVSSCNECPKREALKNESNIPVCFWCMHKKKYSVIDYKEADRHDFPDDCPLKEHSSSVV